MNKKPFSPRALFLFFIATSMISLSACGVAYAPNEPAEESPSTAEEPVVELTSSVPEPLPTQQPIATATSIAGGETDPTPSPTIPERRKLILELPSQIRAGDSDRVLLTLEIDDLGNITPTAQVDGNVVTGEVVEIPNLYETHHVIAEARFDISGMQVSPAELVSQTLSKGQTVRFIWSVRPEDVGVYRGTVWFYLRFVDKVSGEESRKTVSAQLVEIEAVNFLGLPANLVRTAGGVGSLIGAIVGFPFFDDIVKFLFTRRQKRRKQK